jgi:dolichyl-phosphate beta-glucosyltransferase
LGDAAEKYAWKEIPGSSHDVLRRRILRMPAGRRLLDLGAAGGHLGRAVRERCVFLAGVEPSGSVPSSSREGYDDWRSTDALSAGSWPAPFDVVVCADVLEHLPEPERLLARISAWLAPGGTLLVSLPNVANVSVRAALLAGRFPYADRGILDRTHLRFYTRDSGRRLLENAGFRIAEGRADGDALRARVAVPRAVSLVRSLAGLCDRERAPPADAARLPVRLRGASRVTAPSPDGKASLVLPAYNERNRIEACLQRVAEWRASRPGGWDWEVLVVDDGSRDATAAAAERAATAAGLPLTLLRHPANRGKGAAIRAGVLASTGDPVLVSDVDLSTPLSEWVKLAERLPTHPVAIGSRAVDRDLVRRRQPFYRVAFGRAGNLLVRLFAVSGIGDTQCGFKLFRGDLARRLFGQAKIDRFAWDMEILFLARREGVPIAEVPVLWFDSPDSRVSLLRDAPATLRDLIRIRWIHRH